MSRSRVLGPVDMRDSVSLYKNAGITSKVSEDTARKKTLKIAVVDNLTVV